MLTAYLRGLLKPSSAFGLRSFLFEDVILEAMSAHIATENFEISIVADSAVASILTADSKRDVLRRVQRQTQRLAALQLMDIYDLASGQRGRSNGGSGISLLQLFHLMKKEGMIHPDEARSPSDS
jgi:hypothetical protein